MAEAGNHQSGSGRPQAADRGYEHQVPLALGAGPIDLEVSNPNGMVTLRPGDGQDAEVRTIKHGHGPAPDLDVHVADNRVKVEVKFHGGRLDLGQMFSGFMKGDDERGHDRLSRLLGGGGHLDVEVLIPRDRLRAGGSRVRVATASGEVRIEEIPAEIRVTTASGDARLIDVSGPVQTESASGDLLIERFAGPVQVRTASGDVRIVDATLSGIAIATASGDVHLAGDVTAVESCRIRTVSGDVSLEMASAAAGELQFTTVSGDADVDSSLQKSARRTWRFGGDRQGGAVFSVKTVSGDLRARVRALARPHQAGQGRDQDQDQEQDQEQQLAVTAPIPPEPPAPPAAPAPPAPAVFSGEPEQPSAKDSAGGTPVEPVLPGDAERASDSDRLAVLQALERGEIDIEDALNRLDAMDDEPPVA